VVVKARLVCPRRVGDARLDVEARRDRGIEEHKGSTCGRELVRVASRGSLVRLCARDRDIVDDEQTETRWSELSGTGTRVDNKFYEN
jgi:hypothetical protein